MLYNTFVIYLPFAEGYHYKNEGMQGAYLVQTWHRVPPVAHGTDLQIWDPSQTYHPSTEINVKMGTVNEHV